MAAATIPTKATAAKPKLDAPDVKQWQLANGLKVMFLADHKAPVVTVQVFYHAGGKDEPADKRGIAHMFEHMMFKGSKHVPPEEHARFLSLVGGEYNAFTQDDTTAFHETIPPSALEFTLKLEAERMRNLKLTQKTIDSERQVVEEELRVREENSPIMKGVKAELQLAYEVHPYRIGPVGDKKMLDTVTPADCQAFYDRFYRPNNAALIVVGDTDEATVRALADKYFGPLERGPEIKRNLPQEPPQALPRVETLNIPVQLPVVIGAYHIPGGADPDLFALEVLQQILSGGESSRLNQRLVRRDKIAVAAGGVVSAHEDPGLFLMFAAFLPTSDPGKIRTALEDEIARVTQKPVESRELQKARNQLAARAIYERERVTDIATAMGINWIVSHDPLRAFTAPAKYDAVTADDILRVAKKYLVPSNVSIVTLAPPKPAQLAPPKPPAPPSAPKPAAAAPKPTPAPPAWAAPTAAEKGSK
ncbi:MAG TPA: pitrilysin family protein [Polyangia bacterium]|nr:pitrilysin family protein [Polyangia bacterium]